MVSIADASAERVAMALRSIRLVGKFFSLWPVERSVLAHLSSVEDFLVRSYWASVRRRHNIADCRVRLLRLSDPEVEMMLNKFKGPAGPERENSDEVFGSVSPLESALKAEAVDSISSPSFVNKITNRRAASLLRAQEFNYTTRLKGRNRKFFCRSCVYVTKNLTRIKKHQALHLPSRPFVCSRCGCRFMTVTNLNHHLRIRHPGGPQPAPGQPGPGLGTPLPTQEQLLRMRDQVLADARLQARRYAHAHTAHRPFSCALCSFRTDRFKKLEDHQLCHDRKRLFACDRCDSKYFIRSHLEYHFRAEHPGKPPEAGSPGPVSDVFSSDKARPVERPEAFRILNRPLKCDRCPRQFTNKGNLRSHYKAHDKRDRLKAFAAGRLRVPGHARAPGPGPGSTSLCPVCKYRAQCPSALEKHSKVHFLSRKFACDDCTYRMPTEKDLLNHQLRAHGNGYRCEKCPLTVSTLGQYRRHLVRAHQEGARKVAGETTDARDRSSDSSWMVRIPSNFSASVAVPSNSSAFANVSSDRSASAYAPSDLSASENVLPVSAKVLVPSTIPAVPPRPDKKIDRPGDGKKIPILSVPPMRYEQTVASVKKRKAPSPRYIPDGVYQCRSCPLACDSVHKFVQHALTHAPALRCCSCALHAPDAPALLRHMLRHAKRAPLLHCPACPAACRSALWLRRHMCGHRRGANFACEVCGHRTKKYFQLLHHLSKHDPEELWENGGRPSRSDRSPRKAPEEFAESHCAPEDDLAEEYRTVDIEDGVVKSEPEEIEDVIESRQIKSYPVISEVYSVVSDIKRELGDEGSFLETDDDRDRLPVEFEDAAKEGEGEEEGEEEGEKEGCALCCFSSPWAGRRAQHAAWHAAGCPAPCDACGYCNAPARMARHLQVHSKLRPFECDRCFYRFTHRHALTRHRRRTHDIFDKPEKITFANAPESTDLPDKKGEETDSVPEAEKSLLKIWSPPAAVDGRSGDFACERCNFSCRNLARMNSHRRWHSLKYKRQCDVCGFLGSSCSSLKRHSAVHDRDRPIHCERCSYNFWSESSASRHRREAHGEPPEARYSIRANHAPAPAPAPADQSLPPSARYSVPRLSAEPNIEECESARRTSEYSVIRETFPIYRDETKDDPLEITPDHLKEMGGSILQRYLLNNVNDSEYCETVTGSDPKLKMLMNHYDVDENVCPEIRGSPPADESREFIDYSLCEPPAAGEAYEMPADCDDAEYAKSHAVYSREIDRDESSKNSSNDDKPIRVQQPNSFFETEAVGVAVFDVTS